MKSPGNLTTPFLSVKDENQTNSRGEKSVTTWRLWRERTSDCHLKLVDPKDVPALKKQPARVAQLVGGDAPPMPPVNPTAYAQARPWLLYMARFGKRQMGLADPDQTIATLQQMQPTFRADIAAMNGPNDELLLGKAWHGVHYLLTGTAWDESTMLGKAIMGGSEVGEDLGIVKQVAAALDAVKDIDLRRRFKPKRMEDLEIYPNGGWDDAAQAWLEKSFHGLREFYRNAAKKDAAVLIWLD